MGGAKRYPSSLRAKIDGFASLYPSYEAELSSAALCAIAHWGGRPSVPETSMIEPRSRSVLDTPLSRGTTAPCGVAPRLLHLRQHREATDALVLVGVEERVVVPERDAAVGLAARPQHVGVREQPVA